MSHLLGNNRLLAVLAGGTLMAVAAVLMQRVDDGREAVKAGAGVAAVA
jgi:hypothetical protein